VHPLPARRLPSLPRGASLFASTPERPVSRSAGEIGVAPLHPLR
jgi:hypothetical protein